ncbi:MAG: cyclic nucleotide-binding domain-containing protein [Thermoanaerobaculia bacterium]
MSSDENTVFKPGGQRPAPRYKSMEVREGDWVFEEESLGTEMYIVQDGKVEILKRVGDENRQLTVLEKGDFFGEMALLEDLPRAAGARALTDVKVLEINGATFNQMLRDNPEIAVRMMRKLSRRLRETDALLRELGAERIPQGPPAPPDAEAKARAAGTAPEHLVHGKSGMEFPLAGGTETTIGRRDPVTGIYPDVDLSPVDGQRSISRRHAKIFRRGEKYFVAEEIGTMNGTYLNGERLETGVPAELSPGDGLRFGVVELEFRGA